MRPPRLQGFARVALAAGAGVLAAVGHPPANLPYAALAGYAGVLFVLRGRGAVAGAVGGLVFGAAMFGVLLSWSARFGGPALPALALSQALFFVAFGAAAGSRIKGWRWVALTTGSLTLVEATRARWPLGGFEWGQLGYVWHATPVRGLASAVGVLGLTALTCAVCAGVADAVAGRRLPGRRVAVVLAVVSLAAVAASARQWTTPAGGLDLTVVQVAPVCVGPVVRCPLEDTQLLEAFTRATRASGSRPSLFVWGEAALGGESIERLGRLAVGGAGVRSRLLTGVTAPATADRFVNANVLYDASGAAVYRYDKRHPVPFGEYVPFRGVLGGVGNVGALVPSDMVRGTRPGRVPVGATILGTVSSFEGSFSRDVRAAAADPEVQGVAVLTSQASYGRSVVSDQFLAMARLRAAELQKPVVVAATTGRSAVFAPGGSLMGITPLLTTATLDARIELRGGTTPFGRTGDWPVVALAALAVGLAPLLAARRRPTPAAARS